MKGLFLLLFLPSLLFSKVYDCFPFFNELELLRLRFEELWDVVDYFVLVESVETQRGTLKPLYYQDNQSLFVKYHSKIIHVVLDKPHPAMGLWERENYQRNALLRGLKRAHKEDVILISDVDEIPRASLVHSLIPLFKDHPKAVKVLGLQMPIYFFQFNRHTPGYRTWDGRPWYGTVMMTLHTLQKHDPQFFRDHRSDVSTVANAGWHFTWMGGKDKVRQKFLSVVEGGDDASHYTDEYLDRWIASYPFDPIDSTFPHYLVENLLYYKSIGFVAE